MSDSYIQYSKQKTNNYTNNGLTSTVLSGSSMSVLGKLDKTTKAVDTRIPGVKYSSFCPFFYVLVDTIQYISF